MTAALQEYAVQSTYSDPGRHGALLDELPRDIAELTAVVRNVVVHYGGAGELGLTGDRLAEIDSRWIEAALATDQRRNGTPLTTPREPVDRVVGCCRDYTLLTVAALRHQGVPARSRIGFAPYFLPGFNVDHVVVEYWNGERWILVDAQLDPAERLDLRPGDLDRAAFVNAAQAWSGYRRGDLDADDFGVHSQPHLRGGWFIRNYVFQELAHRRRDELLLWDNWGAMATDLEGADLGLTDEIADLLLAADGGDAAAEQTLADRYREDPRLHLDGRVVSYSPAGNGPVPVDLGIRTPIRSVG